MLSMVLHEIHLLLESKPDSKQLSKQALLWSSPTQERWMAAT